MADDVQISETGRQELRGIKAISGLLGVTQRTLRFYEDKGLIEPQRVGATRIYSRREVGRMQLILRGKRLGFSLREIKEFLDLYDVDPEHVEQMRVLAERVRVRLADLEQQRVALDETVGELREIEREVMERIEGR
ncbi:MAG TPA: MerR family DNA-binding transcriptional regulator [Sphingobium sp.]|uniref:MerR family transcriptional regulator n=1 Tax=Sphingobium sp. TaxID=1912891 RepID=UPI002ED3C045